MCGNEEGSYLRLIDSCTTQLKAQRPSKTCDESQEEEEEEEGLRFGVQGAGRRVQVSTLRCRVAGLGFRV